MSQLFLPAPEGLSGKFKILGQVCLGVFVGAVMYYSPEVTIKEELIHPETYQEELTQNSPIEFSAEKKSLKTTIPFVKNNEFDYSELISWAGEDYMDYAWLVFIPIVIFIITAVSNGANLTDGIDGLAAGSSGL